MCVAAWCGQGNGRLSLDEVTGRLRGLRGWRRRLALLGLGALSLLAMAPYYLWPILFITLPALVLVLDGVAVEPGLQARLRSAAAAGWWFGFGFFLVGLYWIGEAFLVEADRFAWLLPFAVTLMPAGLALFHGLACLIAMAFWRVGAGRVIGLAMAFLASEWLRGHVLTGFPWHTLGYALTPNGPMMQAASVVGVYGLTFWAVLIFASPVMLCGDGPGAAGTVWKQRLLLPAAMLVLLAAATGLGALRLQGAASEEVPGVRLRLVQPNIPQAEKWQGDNRLRIFNTFLDASRHNATGTEDKLADRTHVIWPESSIPFLLLQSNEALAAIAELLPLQAILITGALRAQTRPGGAEGTDLDVFNSVAAIDTDGRPVAVFDKLHLVPFGEYLPFQTALEAIGLRQLTNQRGGFAAGTGPRQLAVPGLPTASPLICYEAIFPDYVTGPGPRPAWLLNVTNDAWFGASAGPYQHLHQARVRAVEEGLPLVRVANTGVSVIIDGYGRILQSLPLETRGVIDSGLPLPTQPTYYSSLRAFVLVVHFLFGIGMWRLARVLNV